jgi:uncharacterized cupredoxin-like copper-binding protein
MKNKAYIVLLTATTLLLVSSIALVVGGGTSAYAQEEAVMTIKADKTSYAAGDTITLSGTVGGGTVKAGGGEQQQPVVLQVSNPINAVYRLTKVPVAADGSWNYEFKIGGVLGIRGEYRAVAIYSGKQAETTFSFTKFNFAAAEEAPPLPPPTPPTTTTAAGEKMQTYNVGIGGQEYEIRYVIEGGKVTDIKADPDSSTLTVTVNQTQKGILNIELPRTVVDAKSDGGRDANYTVVVIDHGGGRSSTCI